MKCGGLALFVVLSLSNNDHRRNRSASAPLVLRGGGSRDSTVSTEASANSENSNSNDKNTKLQEEVDNLNDERYQFALPNFLQGEDVQHRCGTYKCLYPLQARYQGKSVGYTAGVHPDLANSLEAAHNFAMTVIEQQFGMQHTFLGAPQTMDLTTTLSSFLDADKVGSNGMPRDDVPKFANQTTVYIQLVDILMQDDTLFWGTSNNKQRMGTGEALQRWIQPLLENNEDKTKRENFVNTFQKDVRQLYQLLEQHECLYDDFQMFVRHDGHIVHFDLDRCFYFNDGLGEVLPKNMDPSTVAERKALLEGFVRQVMQAVSL